MTWFNGDRIRLVFVGISVAFVFSGGSTRADFTFGEPINLGPTVNSTSVDGTPSISADSLKLYFTSDRSGGLGYEDLWVTTRQTIDHPWGLPVNLTTVNSQYREAYPSISADSLELYFSDYFYGPDRPGGQGGHDLWMTSRASLSDSWDTPVNLGPIINSSAQEVSVSISNDALVMIFASNRAGGRGNYDLWMSTRPTAQQDWGPPVNLGSLVNSSGADYECCLSYDGLVLLFMSDRAGGLGGSDAWMTVRKSIDDPWGPPVNLGPPVNTSGADGNVMISTDLRTLYFVSNRTGGVGNYDLWEVALIPVVDFNGDGIVNAADMCIMIDHWGEDYSLCDIGPTPWGDGIVDVEDLKVLAGHLFEEVKDPTLVAHWPLDETQGMVVTDSAGDNDGYAMGNPVWKSDGGQVDGALQFDGVDDYIVTGFVPNPEAGPISILAWIKGGAAGQVILSQMGSVNWLCTDQSGGALMTELTSTGRNGSSLYSEAVITDGNWHRIGFIWDGSHRTLYVDSVVVAEDTQDGLGSSSNGLYIGTGKAMQAGTFWSGLIDDIRIYNRALYP